MARKGKYTPKAFESDGRSNDTSANIYESMLTSEAWKDLSSQERDMYICMKAQYYGKRKPSKDKQYKELPSVSIDETCFWFPYNYTKKYGLPTNKKDFYKRIKNLINHGFIQSVINGKCNQQNSVYKLSSNWKYWKK